MATEDTVSHIAKTLGEVEEIPLSQISGIVRVLGEEGALALLNETQEVEKGGGMLLADGTRRRSPGGVYFQLARRKLPPEEKKIIFREKKAETAADAPPPSSSGGATVASAAGAGDPSRFTRRRVVEVVPARGPVRGKPGQFTPPELPSALTRARIRQQVNQAILPLPIEEQYHLLLDLLADIHDRVSGGASPPPSSEDAPPARPARARSGATRRK
ncbi:MAG TPA: phosphorylated adapter RNA export RNA-binding domain-containing protein [Polyangiaceae bacterium]|jgi:hypothetical protein|nr:phosphorylated adapter RNA export RNA-binding domain-containing protein [Polyangiaceae bacterium]